MGGWCKQYIDRAPVLRVKYVAMKFLADAIAFVDQTETPSPPFRPLTGCALVIVVGLTGVGKSTVIDLLRKQVDFTLLPNRRKITDEIIISSLQQADGHAPHPVTDRVKRFEYTARYRAKHSGGMAHALSRLAVNTERTGNLLLFDGLRGLNEVQHAATYFPQAHFVVLDAPDMVRLNRLLKRGDTFDTTKLQTSLADRNLLAGLQSVSNIEAIFSPEQQQQIARMAYAARYPVDETVKKVSIIVEERRNYDSSTARVYLSHNLPPERVLVVDTATQSPHAVAERVKKWLGH